MYTIEEIQQFDSEMKALTYFALTKREPTCVKVVLKKDGVVIDEFRRENGPDYPETPERIYGGGAE
jgi:hypothetical protein